MSAACLEEVPWDSVLPNISEQLLLLKSAIGGNIFTMEIRNVTSQNPPTRTPKASC